MNTKIYPYFIAVCAICAISSMTACSNDDDPQPDPQPSVELKELGRINTFIDIDVPGDADWQVKAHPTWAGPMADEGTGDTMLKLFVETNDDEADRTDTLTVATTDGKIYLYALVQKGTLRDSDNGEELSEANNAQTYGVGFTLNVLDNTYANTAKYNVMSTTPIAFHKLVKVLRGLGESEAFYREDRYHSFTESIIGSSTEEIATQLAVNGGISLGLDAFNATVTGAFNKNSSDSTHYSYAMQQIRHIISARYLRAGILRYCAENDIDIWGESMVEALEFLKGADNSQTIKDLVKGLVSMYGTHIITYAAMGGELRVSMKMQENSSTSGMDIHGALNLSSKIVNADGHATFTQDEEVISKNTSINLKTFGGSNKFSIFPGMTFQQFQEGIKDRMKAWADGIPSAPALIDIETVPLWDIMPTEESRKAMCEYIMVDLQRTKFGSTFTPALFEIVGFDVTSEVAGTQTLSLDRIGQVVKAERKIVKELSSDKLVTIIYSGAPGKVNENCGFFVGDDVLKPAKVRTSANGTVTIEPLEGWNGGIVEKVYIDATGDITLQPKGIADFYTQVKMPSIIAK
jgi:hypothetical protein